MIRGFLSFFILLSIASATAQTPSSSPLGARQIAQILAAAHAAAGGAQLDAFASVTESGSVNQNGGPPDSFEAVADLRNGYSRVKGVAGPATLLQGYDGAQWSETNGSLSIVSLPSLVADAVTQAYLTSNAYFRPEERPTITSGRLDRTDGWLAYVLHAQPAGGSPADLYFDAATYRLVTAVAQTARGPDTTTYSDFQTVQGVIEAMRWVEVDAAGTTTTAAATSVRFASAIDPAALARPTYISQGTLAAPASIPFASDIAGTVGHIIVPVALDGKPATLIFDSGGGNFLLPQAAQRLGLKAYGGVAVGGLGTEEQMGTFAAVSLIDFAGARLPHQSFVITPEPSFVLRKGISPDGLIGYEYLANFRIAVRYAQRRIDVASFDAPAPAGGVTLPLKSDGQRAYVLATIDGVPGYYALDTGSISAIVLNLPFVQEHHLFPKGGLTYLAPGGIGGGFPETLTAANSFALAGLTYHDVPVGIPQVSSGYFATRGVAGNLGSGFLSRFTIVFDYKAQTVTFIPNENARMRFRSDRVGLSIGQNDNSAFVVGQVIPRSPAADAGIATGDRITAFAAHAVASGYGPGDLYPYSTGTRPFTLTFVATGISKTVTLTPRRLLPPPQ